MWVTYGAAAFLFGGGAIFMLCLIFAPDKNAEIGREVFTMLVPIATGVITYWFADQRSEGSEEPKTPNTGSNGADQPTQPINTTENNPGTDDKK